MPITPSAIKKMRRDQKKTLVNRRTKSNLTTRIKIFRANPSVDTLPQIFSVLDRAAKTYLIHRNRANRLKSRLSRLISS